MKLLRKSSLILIATVLVSCAPKNAPIELRPGLQQLEVLHRIQELQRTVIAVHDANPVKLSKTNADLIVKFTLAANDVVSTGAPNWQNVTKSLWNSLKNSYTPPPNLLPIWSIINTLITGL